jgi:hypothetical protein
MDEPGKKPLWRRIARVLSWTIAWTIVVIVGLLILVTNWPLSDKAWTAISIGMAVVLLGWLYQNTAARRHSDMLIRLSTIDYRIRKLEDTVNRIEHPDLQPGGRSRPISDR